MVSRLIPTNSSSESLLSGIPYPLEYHFLMTNYCNARCIFCNQLDNKPRNEITLDKFKVMISHIAVNDADRFYFSGGGEPLLCRDLFDIIQYVNRCFPHIKIRLVTNGLLIEKYAENIAKLNIERLIISVHGTEEMNNYILQIKNSERIFEGLFLLNKYQKRFDQKIYKVFCITVSRININEIPGLIKKAAELNINEVSIQYCRYHPHRISKKLKVEDSLFFHKEMYNAMIKKSFRLASKLGVSFKHEPFFLEKFNELWCSLPWYLILVDWDGDVYPCTTGEVRFYKKVKSGVYHFGNLLKQDISAFWFNKLYTKLRRQALACRPKKYIPECNDCYKILCFRGPDLKKGHIISS